MPHPISDENHLIGCFVIPKPICQFLICLGDGGPGVAGGFRGEGGEAFRMVPRVDEIGGAAEVGGALTENGAVENVVMGGNSAASRHGLKEAWIGAPRGMSVHIKAAPLTERLRVVGIKIGLELNEVWMRSKSLN